MRKFCIFIWLLVPLGAAAYHFGPGQENIKMDQVDTFIASAQEHLKNDEFGEAVTQFDQAINLMPTKKTSAAYKLRLEKAKAQMQCAQLPEAYKDLLSMSGALDENTNPKLAADTKSTLANAQYYITWLMRLEGHSREVWEPVIESSRQNYHAVAQFAQLKGDQQSANQSLENLEAAIKLARIDLDELQGLPLPNQ